MWWYSLNLKLVYFNVTIFGWYKNPKCVFRKCCCVMTSAYMTAIHWKICLSFCHWRATVNPGGQRQDNVLWRLLGQIQVQNLDGTNHSSFNPKDALTVWGLTVCKQAGYLQGFWFSPQKTHHPQFISYQKRKIKWRASKATKNKWCFGGSLQLFTW